MHAEQRTPPYGLSGLFAVFGKFLIVAGISLGTPASAFAHTPQTALLGLR